MHGELTPRLAQPVDGQKLQHLRPGDIAALLGELLLPEARQAQFLPEQASQPAVSEGPWPQQPHLRQDNRERIGLIGWDGAVGRKQRELAGLPGILVEHRNGLPPGEFLAVVDLSEVEHLPLLDAAVGQAVGFDDAPVAVQLAVFLP